MKIRSTIFGYQYQNGKITIHPQESIYLKRIFDCYTNGMSLLKIAEMLDAEGVEYTPGIIGWNKARLMRIVENEKYLGDESYPVMITAETYEEIQRLKSSKNHQKYTDRKADIFQINLPVICESCGGELRRRHDSRSKCKQKWTCQNDDCRNIINISDNEFLQNITDCLNTVIKNPNIIKNNDIPLAEPSNDVRRLNNEISRTLEGFGFDKEILRKKMMECISLKYKEIESASYITKRMKSEFEQTSPLDTFSIDFCSRTVKSITLSVNKEITLTLINGQQIGKEQPNDTDSNSTSAESSTTNPCNH